MKNKKRVALWIIWLCLTGALIHHVKEISLHLLWIDIKAGLQLSSDNIHKLMIVLAIFLGAILVCWCTSSKGFIRLSWKVRVGEKEAELHTYKFPYAYTMLLAGISFFMLLTAMFLRDIFVARNGEQLESISVAHAFGGIDGTPYTNSKEALLYNYDLGHRAFEVDFSITSDRKLVCLHDWNHAARILGRNEAEILSKDEFESSSIWERYTPISVQEFLLFMSEHDDVWIVTDSKETSADLITLEFSYIVDAAKELGVEQVLDRIAVQIYNKEMYSVVCEIYEFPCIIFTLYQYWNGDVKGFPDICRFCAYNDIHIITMWYGYVTPEVMKIAEQYGVKVYAYTVNDIETVTELKRIGVAGFYTDYLTPKMLEYY